MRTDRRWVLLAYRLPREPSTPRIAIWRQLRRLGALQLVDGVVALPLDARTREALEWLAQAVEEANGEATIWLAEPATTAQDRRLVEQMQAIVGSEYVELAAEARSVATRGGSGRARTLGRLRRELRRIRQRDYFGSPSFDGVRLAIEAIGTREEAAS